MSTNKPTSHCKNSVAFSSVATSLSQLKLILLSLQLSLFTSWFFKISFPIWRLSGSCSHCLLFIIMSSLTRAGASHSSALLIHFQCPLVLWWRHSVQPIQSTVAIKQIHWQSSSIFLQANCFLKRKSSSRRDQIGFIVCFQSTDQKICLRL